MDTVVTFAFPSDTRTAVAATLTSVNTLMGCFADAGVAGYVGGGYDGSAYVTRVDKFAFPSNTKSTISDTLTTGSSNMGAFANCGVF